MRTSFFSFHVTGDVKEMKFLSMLGLTAHASDVFRDKCLEAGMDDFVSKVLTFALSSLKIYLFFFSFAGTLELLHLKQEIS